MTLNKKTNFKLFFLNVINNKKSFFNLILACIIFVTLVKFFLIGSGFFACPDEWRYTNSKKSLDCLLNLRFKDAATNIFLTQGRPADALIKIIPCSIQLISSNVFNLSFYDKKNSYPLFIFNYLIFCLILIIHYKFSKILTKDSFLSLVSVLLFSSLTNSYLYIRHSLPYDGSLLLFYFTLYKIIKYSENECLTSMKLMFLGFLAFFSYLVYPGYFPLFIACITFIFFHKLTSNTFLKRIYKTFFFALGSVVCLMLFELLSNIGNRSLISDAIILAKSINQGSFEESFSFIFKYLFEVEGLTGILIILCLTLAYSFFIYQIITKTAKTYQSLILLSFIFLSLFIIYACIGHFFHQMIFYGRLLHQYIPFICTASVLGLYICFEKITDKNILLLTLFSIIVITNFVIKFSNYNSFYYPRDIAWEYIEKNSYKHLTIVCEYDDCCPVAPFYEEIKPQINVDTNKIYIINCCYNFPVNDINKFHLFTPKDTSFKLIESYPHFLNQKAYQYEGFSIAERKNLDIMNLHLKIYSK